MTGVQTCALPIIDISSVKLVLTRKSQEVQRLEGGESKKSRHHIMMVDLDRRFYKSLDDVRPKALPMSQAKTEALPAPDESRDPLFFQDAEKEEPVSDAKIHGAKAGSSTIDDIPKGGDINATPDQIADIATMTEALKDRGKTGKSINTELWRVLKQKHGVDIEVKKDLTVEEASTAVAFLKGWLVNIDGKRKVAGD